MYFPLALCIVSLTAFLSWILLGPLVSWLSQRFLDHPNFRSSHQKPTPRGGGIVFVVIASLASAVSLLIDYNLNFPISGIFLLAVPLALVGFLDDWINLSVEIRFVVQIFVSLLIAFIGALTLTWIAFPLVLIAITAVINFTNFMDGIDGLVAGCMVVAISALSHALNAPWSVWALVGSLLGFLIWNWSPAKVFMGDVGSTYLGAVFAGLVLQAANWTETFCYLLVITPMMADACICTLRRWCAGQSLFKAHRLHLFQRLHQAGWPHTRVSLTYIFATAALSIAMLAGGLSWVLSLAVIEILLGVWLDQRVAVPFGVASKS